jgi:hypothetical protein
MAQHIPDLVYHYHFLGAIGRKLFDAGYSSLRKLLQRDSNGYEVQE